MNYILWITPFMLVISNSFGQIPVESCISYNSSENPMLNIKWDNENIDLLSNVFVVLYRTEESGVLAGENCIEGNNKTNINIVQGLDYVVEVRTTPRDFCNPDGPNIPLLMGSSTAEYGYISSLDSFISDDNSTITFICHMACQTDFITGCNVSLMDACGKELTQSCTVNNTQTFSPRQCSVVFQDLPPSSYDYIAKVQSNDPLQFEENILNMTGTLVTAADTHIVGVPTNVTSTVLTSRSVKITWDLSLGYDIMGYLISYTTIVSYASDGNVIVNGNSTNGILTNLEENTLYTITVHAIANNTLYCNSTEVQTLIYTDVPSSPPQNVMITSVNIATLTVSWQPPPVIDQNGLLTGLVKDVNYSVRVAAMNINGTGPFSNPVVVQVPNTETITTTLSPSVSQHVTETLTTTHSPSVLQPESSSSDDDNIGAIIGTVVGGIVGIIFITTLLSVTLWYYCKQLKKASTPGNPPVAMNDVTTHDMQHPVPDMESNPAYQIVKSDQVKMELDPAYQELSAHSNRSVQDPVSHTVKEQANRAYQVVTSDQVKNGPDPAYQGLSKLLQVPISDETKKEFNSHYLETSDQVKQGPDPAYQVVTSDQVKMEHDPAYQVLSPHSKSDTQGPVSDRVTMNSNRAEQALASYQVKLGLDPAYQQLLSH